VAVAVVVVAATEPILVAEIIIAIILVTEAVLLK
jgi:hypothetical protein